MRGSIWTSHGIWGPVVDTFPEYSQVLWVGSATNLREDGRQSRPYDTIAEALVTANALSPSTTNRILIAIMPGTYDESGLTVPDYVHFLGMDPETCIVENFSATIFTVGSGIETSFRNLQIRTTGVPIDIIDVDSGTATAENCILKGTIPMVGTGFNVTVRRCTLDGIFEIVAGSDATSSLLVEDSTVIAVVTDNAIRFSDADPSVVVRNSRLEGKATKPAVYWDVGVTNNNLVLENCRVYHGDGSGNDPFGRNASQTPTYVASDCVFTSRPHSDWTNSKAAWNTYVDEAYMSLGTPATGHSLDALEDLFVAGEIEVDGTAFFDGNARFHLEARFDNAGGTTHVGSVRGKPDDGLHIGINATDGNGNNNLIVCPYDFIAADYGHNPGSAHPTVFIQSNTNPGTATTEYGTISFDGAGDGTGVFRIQTPFSGNYTAIGSGTLTHNLTPTDGDLLVSDTLEVVNGIYSQASIHTYHTNFFYAQGTTNVVGAIVGEEDDGLHIGLSQNDNLILCSYDHRLKDFDHSTASNDPTFFYHSDTDPDTANTEWGSVSFEGTGAGDGVFRILTGSGYTAFGANSTGHAIGAGGVLVSGPLEVDGSAHFDGQLISYDTIQSQSLLQIQSGGTIYGTIRAKNDDGMHIGVDGTNGIGNFHLIICNQIDQSKDFDHETLSSDPTVIFHSATNPDTNNTEWGSISFVGTGAGDGVFRLRVGTGYTAVGTGTSSRSAGTEDLVVGMLEANSKCWLDNGFEAGNTCTFNNNTTFKADTFWYDGATDYIGVMEPRADDGLLLAIDHQDGKGNNHFILSQYTNRQKNHGHSTPASDPTLIIHSATDPTSYSTEWGSFWYDGDAAGSGTFTFNTGAGGMLLDPVDGVTVKSGDKTEADTSDITLQTGDCTMSGTSGDVIVNIGAGVTADGVFKVNKPGTTSDPFLEVNDIGVRLQREVEEATSNDTLTEEETFKVFSNKGATGTVTFTLPQSASIERAGIQYTFYVQAGYILEIETADTIRMGDVSQAGGGGTAGIRSATVGNWVTVVSVDTTEWVVMAPWYGDWELYYSA